MRSGGCGRRSSARKAPSPISPRRSSRSRRKRALWLAAGQPASANTKTQRRRPALRSPPWIDLLRAASAKFQKVDRLFQLKGGRAPAAFDILLVAPAHASSLARAFRRGIVAADPRNVAPRDPGRRDAGKSEQEGYAASYKSMRSRPAPASESFIPI